MLANIRKFSLRAVLATAMATTLFGAASVQAQSYPSRPVKIIIPYAAGGGADAVSRRLAVQLEKALGQPFVIESKSGGNTIIAAMAVAKAPPDGYTLLMTGGSTMSLVPLTAKSVPYDPVADFLPVSMLSKGPYLVCVSAELGAQSLAEVIQMAKAKPGELAYASNAIGGSAHLAFELLSQRANIKMTHVPYKGFAPAISDVIAGRTPLTMLDLATLGGHAKTGRIKVVASTAAQRSPMFPDVPTVAELGFPGYEVETWFALYAPAHTPADIVARVGEETRKWLATEQARESLAALGQEAAPLGPDAVRQRIVAEQSSYRPLIEAAQIKTD